MKAYKKLMNGVAEIEKIVLSVLLVFVTALTFADVVVRKLTDSSFAWTEELVINLFVLIIMMGCALCVREGGLISLSLIYDRLSAKAQKVFVAIITVANLAFWVLLVRTGIDKVLTQMASGKRTTSLGVLEWKFQIFLPIGAALLILHSIEFFVDMMAKRPEKEEATDD